MQAYSSRALTRSVRGSWNLWLALARHPVFSTVANALGVFAGFVGALYTDDVRAAFPFRWGGWTGFAYHALIFWVFFIVFAFTFLSREWAADRLRAESERRLEDTIRTMPPRGFVLEFAQYFQQCHRATRAVENAASPKTDQIREAVCLTLSSVVHLASKYDAADGATYAANIMLYFESADAWKKYSGSTGHPEIKFAERDAAKDRLPLLVLEKRLSASTKSGPSSHGGPDPELTRLPDIALPVPEQSHAGRTEDGKRWRVLPGAPLTFFTLEPNIYEDTGALGEWCREHGDFSESICLEVEQYFGQDAVRRSIRSFASVPIISEDGASRIGVLNLHSSRPGILKDPGAPSQFFPLIQPFTRLLSVYC